MDTQYTHGSYNNQAGRDINHTYNFVSRLKASPKSIKLVATLSNGFIALTGFIVLLIIVISIEIMIHEHDPYMIGMFIMFAPLMVAFIEGTDKIMRSYSWGHVVYLNGSLMVKGRERKFYDEIWDMKLSNLPWNKRTITYYAVNPDTLKIYYNTIKFMYHTEAKYVYDSFWSGKPVEIEEEKRTD